MLEYLGFEDAEIVKLLKGGKHKLPKRLSPDKINCQDADVKYIHQLTAKHDIYIADYMYKLHRQEQDQNRQAYFDKIEQDALLYRMQQNYQPHYTDML